MSVRIIVTDSKYYSELKNGSNFALNPSDFGNHLKGNFGEKLKAELTVQVSWRMGLSNYQITNSNTITLSSGSFFQEGFSVGDSAAYSQVRVSGGSTTFNIVSISSDGLEMVTDSVLLPNGQHGLTDVDFLRGLTPLEGLKYKFNFIDNQANTNFISSLDQTTLAYKADGIRTSSPTPIVSTWDDTILGSQTGNQQVTFIQDISDGGIIETGGVQKFPLNSIQEFKIEHEFILFPYFLDGELTNLENLLRPERIEAGKSYKHVVDFEFRSTLSNPNTAKTGRWDNVLGQTSYFNENFGDEPTQYSISGLTLTAGGSPVTGIDALSTTNVSFSVINADGVTNPFLTADPVVFYISKLPDLEEYNASTSIFETTWSYESLRGEIDGSPNSGTIISNLDINLDSTTQFSVSVDILPQANVENGDNYILCIGVGDDALSTDLSNKSILKVNLSEYIKNQDVSGLMDVTKLEVYTHPMAFSEGVTQGYTGLKGWVQDGVMWDWEFTLDRSLNAVLERFRVRLVALKTADDTFFPLEDVEYDLSTQVVTPGPPTIQQIEIEEERGFPLGPNSIFNLKTFKTGAYSAPDQTYSGQTSFLINWQEWLALPSADTVFYDPSEPNNGLNQKASQYSLKEGYEIRFLIDVDVSVDGSSVTNYIFKSPDATILDFEEQDGTPITWTAIKETFDEDGANVNQEILTNQNTRVKFTYVPSSPPGLASLYWGHITIEEANQPGVAIDRISTLNYRPLTGQGILIPLSGETRVKQSIVSGNLEHEVLIDYTKLDPAKNYNVYGRPGLIDQTPIVPPEIFKEISIDFDNNRNFAVFQQPEIMANASLTDALFQLLDGSGDIVFKSALSNLGGNRSNWSGATTYANFAALSLDLAANSNLYIYVEVNTTNYPNILKEGLIIQYEILGSAVSPTQFTITNIATGFDREQIRWFNQKVELSIQSFNLGGVSAKRHISYGLRVASTAGDDYVTYPQGRDSNPSTGIDTALAALNLAIDALADDTKYGVHVFMEVDDSEPNPTYTNQFITFNVEYTQAGSEDYEVELQAGMNTVNDQRSWTNRTPTSTPGATTLAGGVAPITQTTRGCSIGTGLNTFFDFQNGNQWCAEFWVEGGSGTTSLNNQTLMNNIGDSLSATRFPLGSGMWLVFNEISVSALFAHSGIYTGTNRYLWARGDYNNAPGYKKHIVYVCDPVNSAGFWRASSFKIFVDGKELNVSAVNETLSVNAAFPTDGAEPSSTMGAGTLKPIQFMSTVQEAASPGAFPLKSTSRTDSTNKMHEVTLWQNRILTPEEIYQLHKQGSATSKPHSGDIIHRWDFANPDTTSLIIPDTVGSLDADLLEGDDATSWSTFVSDNGIQDWLTQGIV